MDEEEKAAHYFIDAADTVEWRWRQYENARTALEQADALINLSNAMSDMASWLPNYNRETGEVDRPEV